MDRNSVERRLAEAERGICQSILNLERLSVLAADLDIAGADSRPTRALIASCAEDQATQISERDELLRTLSALTQAP